MKKICTYIYGSHLYGLNTEQSDLDLKSIYIPDFREIVLKDRIKGIKESTGNPNGKNGPEDVDHEHIPLAKFVKMGIAGETLVLDSLHVRKFVMRGKLAHLFDFMIENRQKFYTKSMKAYVGYVQRQAAKYGIKGSRLAALKEILDKLELLLMSHENDARLVDITHLLPQNEYAKLITYRQHNHPVGMYQVFGKSHQLHTKLHEFYTRMRAEYEKFGSRAILAMKNEGVDWKAVSHAFRVAFQAKHIFLDGDFEYPLPESGFIRKVKAGKLDFKIEVQPELEKLVDEVKQLSAKSSLPEQCDSEFWEDFIVDSYRDVML